MREKHSWWNARRGRVRHDAADLVATYGDLALAVAERVARHERRGLPISAALPKGHWQAVLREVRRKRR